MTWKVKVNKSELSHGRTGVSFGVTVEDSIESMLACAKTNERKNELWDSYGFCWTGELYHRSNEGKPYCNQQISLGDVVEVHLDMQRRQISFKLNDLDLGVAFENIDDSKIYRLHIGL